MIPFIAEHRRPSWSSGDRAVANGIEAAFEEGRKAVPALA